MNNLAAAWDDKFMNNMVSGKLLKNQPLAKYTSWRVGGPARQLFLPNDRQDLVNFIAALPNSETIFWMGLGSNLLIRDGGIDATVINTRSCLKAMRILDDNLESGIQKVYVEAGVYCAQAARFCSQSGLSGAEFLAGIPGTIGGALNMNAGAFGGATWEIVEQVEMIQASGVVIIRNAEEFKVAYRSVEKKSDEWFLSAVLRLPVSENGENYDKIRGLLAKRSQTQPLNQMTCGSVFKNPEGDYAARLIEASGLKGHQIGQAMVSEKHANFIVNLGGASAADIEALIEFVQTQVNHQQGVELSTEVCIVGEKGSQ